MPENSYSKILLVVRWQRVAARMILLTLLSICSSFALVISQTVLQYKAEGNEYELTNVRNMLKVARLEVSQTFATLMQVILAVAVSFARYILPLALRVIPRVTISNLVGIGAPSRMKFGRWLLK